MKRIRKAFSVCILTLLTAILFFVLLFYLLVVFGISPKTQTLWICSTMHTMSHRYLSTTFFTDEYIEKILEKNAVDDESADSDIITFSSDLNFTLYHSEAGKVNHETSEYDDPYLSEGYVKLEEGIYRKDVRDVIWRGNLLLITNPKRVKVVDTSEQFVCGETVMTMVENENGIAGINGGAFNDGENYDSNGGNPKGLLIEDGNLVFPLDPDDNTVYHMIGLNSVGQLILRHCTANWALENGIVGCVTFSPFLIVNGQGLVNESSGGWGIASRTAIGQRETGEIIFLVIDGRQPGWSLGCDLDVVQKILLDEKAYNAALLDGGSSTTMVYRNTYINRPSRGYERSINNCFVVLEIPE